MIPAAALLVLLGLGLFVGGVLTGVTLYYWLCVAACAVAGLLLVLARARMRREPAAVPAPAVPPVGRGTTAGERPPGSGQDPAAAPVGDPAVPPVVGPGTAGPLPATPPPSRPLPVAPPSTGPLPAASPSGGPPPSTGAHAPGGRSRAHGPAGDPPAEEVEVTDLLLVFDLRDEVLVVDEHPHYHVPGCRWLAGRETIPLPMDEARTDGFTPCGWCTPDRTLAERERGRRAGRGT